MLRQLLQDTTTVRGRHPRTRMRATADQARVPRKRQARWTRNAEQNALIVMRKLGYLLTFYRLFEADSELLGPALQFVRPDRWVCAPLVRGCI